MKNSSLNKATFRSFLNPCSQRQPGNHQQTTAKHTSWRQFRVTSTLQKLHHEKTVQGNRLRISPAQLHGPSKAEACWPGKHGDTGETRQHDGDQQKAAMSEIYPRSTPNPPREGTRSRVCQERSCLQHPLLPNTKYLFAFQAISVELRYCHTPSCMRRSCGLGFHSSSKPHRRFSTRQTLAS